MALATMGYRYSYWILHIAELHQKLNIHKSSSYKQPQGISKCIDYTLLAAGERWILQIGVVWLTGVADEAKTMVWKHIPIRTSDNFDATCITIDILFTLSKNMAALWHIHGEKYDERAQIFISWKRRYVFDRKS